MKFSKGDCEPVVDIEIFPEGGKTLIEPTKHSPYTRNVTSYIISGRPGVALRSFVTNG